MCASGASAHLSKGCGAWRPYDGHGGLWRPLGVAFRVVPVSFWRGRWVCPGAPSPHLWEHPARPVPLTLPLLAQSVPAEKKRLLPVHSLDFEPDSDESGPSGGRPPSLQVSGLSLLCHPSRITGAPCRGQGACQAPGYDGQGAVEEGDTGPRKAHPPRGRLSREVGRRAAESGAQGIQGGCLSPE